MSLFGWLFGSTQESKKIIVSTLFDAPGADRIQKDDEVYGFLGADRSGISSLIRALGQMKRCEKDEKNFRVSVLDPKTTRKLEFFELIQEKDKNRNRPRIWLVDLLKLSNRTTLTRCTIIFYIVGTGLRYPTKHASLDAKFLFREFREKVIFLHTRADEIFRELKDRSSEDRKRWQANYIKELGGDHLFLKLRWTTAANFAVEDTKEVEVNQAVIDLRHLLVHGRSEVQPPCLPFWNAIKTEHVLGFVAVATVGTTLTMAGIHHEDTMEVLSPMIEGFKGK